ncbi:hypothetical protein [Flavobacterium subsaxonicum]|uniref:Uncharacterized protein n=1 Tax=Flavobacterium subsaxonicum WB 4.1-42 = DSM 21790 TaxID=1121898 RepID=A0A0A2MV92_9FLAO|nr:hypothetical protein [Flavobacterium subsaxonicum]KGO92130.1 hypothetical protein Q766_14670 [Flavobacterium subsaxonicum WB 4.1-42 = DSM 21790]
MGTIIGSFYLKPTDNGNLTGEFTNNRLFTVATENATLVEKGTEPFIGKYSSTWDGVDGPATGNLTIAFIESTVPSNVKYKLVWTDWDGTVLFTGEALLAEGLLIGHYVSVK